MHATPLLMFFIASAILNLSLAVYGWRRRRLPGASAFSLAMFVFSILPLSQAVNMTNSDLAVKVIALKSRVEMAGIGATAWLVMTMQFSGYSHLVNRRFLTVLSIVPLVTLLLNWTENSLFRSGYYVETLGDSSILHWTNGPLFWFGLIYLNAILLTPIYLLWRSYGRISPLSFRQSLALGVSTILPLLVNALAQTGLATIPGINFPFAAGPIMGLIVAWAILRYQIFDLVPVARGLLIESMTDGILVVDTQNRIVDMNPAMQHWIGANAIGQFAGSVFAAWPSLIERFRGISDTRTEIVVGTAPPAYFDLRISPLSDGRGRLTGRLIVVRDITEQKRTEAALRASESKFRLMLESAPDAMLIVDQAGSITLANAQAEKMFGYPQRELLGQSVEMLLPKRFQEIHEAHRANYYRDPQTRRMGADSAKWELTGQRKDGGEFPVEISLSPLDTETGLRVTAAIRDITVRRQMETRLQLQAAALKAAANAIVITDRNGVIEWTNPAFTSLTGYTFEESLGQTLHLQRSGRHSDAFYENLWNTIQAGLVWEDEIINRRKDGVEYVEYQTITPVLDKNGAISHFISIKEDFSVRRQIEDELTEERNLLQALMDNFPDTIYFKDVGSRFTRINRAQTKVLGVERPEDAIGKTDFDFQPRELAEALFAEEQKLVKTGEPIIDQVEYNPTADGKPRWFSATKVPRKNREGQVTGIVGVSRNITERKRAEEELQETRNFLQQVLDTSPNMIFVKDDMGRAVFVNQYTAEYYGTRPEDLISKSTEHVHGTASEALGYVNDDQEVLRTRQRIDKEELNTAPNGDQHWFHTVKVPLLRPDGNVQVLGISTDITERKKVEASLRRQNDYLAALHQINLDLLNRHDVDDLLSGIVNRAAELLDAPYSDIALWDGHALTVRATTNTAYAGIGEAVPPNEGMAWQVYSRGKSLVVDDYVRWENHRPMLDPLKLHAVAVVPIMAGEKCVGELSLARLEPHRPFDSDQVHILTLFAQLASLVLDNTELFTKATRRSQELALLNEARTAIARELDLTHIFKRIVEAVAATFGYTLVSLYMREGDMLILQHQVGYENVIPQIPVSQGVSGRVVRTGQPVLLEDIRSDPSFLGAIEGIVSEIAVPVFDEGQPLGVLNVESSQGIKLTEVDLNLMLALSDQISIAISRARVYEALRRKNERLSVLHETALNLLDQRQLDDMPQTITDQIVKLLDSSGGYIALQEGDDLVDKAVTPRDYPYQMISTGSGYRDSPVWHVYQSREVFVTENYSVLTNIRPQTAALGIRAALLLPIMYGETCKGVVGALRFKSNDPFDEDDIRFGNLYSKLATVALDNAQLQESLRQESIRDPLTGLYNRRFMQETLTKELGRAERKSLPLVVVMIDLDYLKEINDAHGHSAGDQALRKLSLVLMTKIRAGDTACRYGGDEFTLILSDTTVNHAVLRMEQLRKEIKNIPMQHEAKMIRRLSLSAGIAEYPKHGMTGQELLAAADRALYRAKQEGRDRVIVA